MTARLQLFLLWFLSYAVCFVSILIFVPLDFAFVDQIPMYLIQVTGIYVPYLTPILAFWFVEDTRKKRQHSRQSVIVAFSTSAFYNLVMIIIVWSVFFQARGADVIEDTIRLMLFVGTLLAFLVGPAIGYFFGKVEA